MDSIIKRAFSPFAVALRAITLTLVICATGGAWADFAKTNPVTGETENYTWKFVGTDTWNGTGYWQDSSGANPSGVPAKSGENTWDPILFDGSTINIAAGMSVEGWNLRLGLYNGANVRLNTFVKWQGDTTMWVTVDDTSKFTVGGFGKGNIANNQVIKCSTTRQNGIEWLVNLESTGNANNTFEYYLKGAGSVSYQAVSAANHKIKMADVTLSGGAKSVQSKTLVSFTSTDKTFTADATIKVKDGDDVLKNVYLTSVTADATTLTTAAEVGTCELVQTSTGIVLYYVDGDPEDMPVYKPSININFTNVSDNGLTTGADVGLTGYEVPGKLWNNYVVDNATFSTVNAVDSTGTASVESGVSVTISGTRGSYSCSGLTAASNPLHGYIDENDSNMTPTVTVSGIPYYKYRVLVYHSTDSANVPFGYDTINGTNYTYDNGALTEGTTAWGDSGASNNANAISEGGNVLLTGELSGSTLTVVGHRAGGDSSARGCIAAIQIIEVKPEISENDLEIPVSGDTTYTVSEAKTLSGTVYITGSGTLTLDGSAKISATTIEIGPLVTLNANADCLDGTYTGSGTVVYDGVAPLTGKGWTESAWTGTVWFKNYTTKLAAFDINPYGNANSTLRLTGLNGYFQRNNSVTQNVPVELVDDGATPAWTYNDGWGGSVVAFAALKGNGTFKTESAGNGEIIYFADATGFTGSFNLAMKKVVLGGSTPSGNNQNYNGKIVVAGTATVSSSSTWTAGGGFEVTGTLYDFGTLASSKTTGAITGNGTVVFGGVPSPIDGDSETKWWKNTGWTGTVEISGVSNITGTNYAFSDYGNAGSTVKLTNCSGWLKNNYTCVPALEIDGTFNWNDGISGLNNVFKVGTLKGSGTISIPANGADKAVWQVTDDWSGFTGAVVGNNTHGRRVLVFGSTLPTEISAGEIYVSPGATLDLNNASGTWWTLGTGFVVDGTLKAAERGKWGGGTAMSIGDTGVLELTSTGNKEDYADYSGVTGTGTIKYSSTAGWRTFPVDEAKTPPTTLTIQTELANSLIITRDAGRETVIGNLAGSKNIRSDWNPSGSDSANHPRTLTVTQSKDTEWQGKFVSNRITQFNVVAPAEGDAGTLTLSGTQTESIPAVISGKVNLTGTWVGATTVSGTFGGTGTVTGALTFNDGATFKANTNALTVSGTVTFPGEGESATVDMSGVAESITSSGLTLISSGVSDISNVEVADGYYLDVDSGALKVYPLAATVTFSDNSVTNYPSMQAALTAVASLSSSAYKYLTAYESATLEYYSANTLKMKTGGVGVVVTLHFPGEYGDYGWVGGEPDENGVVTYSPAATPTVYTWGGGDSGNWWAFTNWKFGDSNYSANRAPMDGDDLIFTSDTEVAVAGNQTVSSITNSATVTFTASDAATITASTGGIVLTDADATITVSNVELSPAPSTSIAGKMVVGETDPETSAVTYSVVDIAAKIDDTPYATLAEALAVEGDTLIALQQDITGDVILRPGQTLFLNGKTVSGTIGGNELGVEVIDYGGMHMYYTCVDNRTNSWILDGGSGNWGAVTSWLNNTLPGEYTSVTIPATEGHATAITLSGDVSIKSLTLGAGETLTLTAASAVTLTTTEAIVLTSGQSITLGVGVTLSATPYTNDARSRVVYDEATRTYSVQVIPGTIFSVY